MSYFKELIKRRLRRCFESFGVERLSHPSLNNIDRKILTYLGSEPGFFIEAGANNGFDQSNTYYLERFHNWRGILVEAIPRLAERCRRERPHSKVFNCALVPFDFKEDHIEIYDANLMSIAKGKMD